MNVNNRDIVLKNIIFKVREIHLNSKAYNPWSIHTFMLMAYINGPYLCPLFMLIRFVWGRVFAIETP